MKKFLALAALAIAAPALADGLVENVNGITLDKDGKVIRFNAVLIGNDGKVTGSSLHRGSGHGVLDSATEQLGTRLAGLDTGVRGSSFSVRVPVEYSLH